MSDLRVTITAGRPALWRVLHDFELVVTHAPDTFDRPGLPEVQPLAPADIVPFPETWQHLSFALNPAMTGDKWRSLYQWNRAFCNGQGFNNDADPHADYVNERDLNKPLPAFDKVRVCGGAVITGVVLGTSLIVETMDATQPAPALEWVLERPWFYFHAVNCADLKGTITNFPQANGAPVLVPLFANSPVSIQLNHLQPWTQPGIPDPRRIYITA